MKIDRIEAIPMSYTMPEPLYSGVGKFSQRTMCLVRVYTDTGLCGLGEAAPYGGPVQTTADALMREIAPLCIGEDPRMIERIWHKCYYARFQHARGGVVMSALSGVDMALWDLLGKITEQPLYKLLGGFRNSMPGYASAGFYKKGKTLESLLSECRGYLDEGLAGVKIKVGRTRNAFSLAEFNDDEGVPFVDLEDEIDMVAEVKKLLGKDRKLMVDVNCTWSYTEALEAGRIFDKIGLYFMEEPIRTDDYEHYAALCRELKTPVAGCETECMSANYMRLIRNDCVDIVQPDVSWCGGISEAKRIAGMAYGAFKECAPHSWNSGILLAASLHLGCALPNCWIMEYDRTPNVFRDELLEEPVRPDANGMFHLTEKPGIGAEVREDIVEQYRIDR